MPSYPIRVRSSEPLKASQSMHAAGMPTIGPTVGGFAQAPDGRWTIGEEFTVFVSAPDIPRALDRVGEVEAGVEILAVPYPSTEIAPGAPGDPDAGVER